jgi:hypothetical protein
MPVFLPVQNPRFSRPQVLDKSGLTNVTSDGNLGKNIFYALEGKLVVYSEVYRWVRKPSCCQRAMGESKSGHIRRFRPFQDAGKKIGNTFFADYRRFCHLAKGDYLKPPTAAAKPKRIILASTLVSSK